MQAKFFILEPKHILINFYLLFLFIFALRSSIKDIRTKSQKNWPLPLFREVSALAQPLPLIISFLYQTVRTFTSEEPSLSAKCPHWTTLSPWVRTSFTDSHFPLKGHFIPIIGRNFVVKNAKTISEHNAITFTWKFLIVTEKSLNKTKWFHSVLTSLTTFTPNHVYSQIKICLIS